ncbi:MAG: response regulator [Bdellovibrionales bacterium]|nr:response regulator [Bdellovibrionales bacterium]
MFAPTTRILVVDDMMTMRKLISKALKDMGFKDITEAPDGVVAWETVSAAAPPIGLIISDWNMPNCSGLDFLKRVRADSRYSKTPFVLVTAESEAKQVAEALKAGVSHYVVKPFTPDNLKARIEETYKKVNAAQAA